jgi:hypothetical protein
MDFSVPGHLQMWFGESFEANQQRRLCHRRSATAREMKNVFCIGGENTKKIVCNKCFLYLSSLSI